MDENSGFVIVAFLAVVMVGGFWWYHSGNNPEAAAALGRAGRAVMMGIKALLLALGGVAAVWIGRRFAWRRWCQLPRLIRGSVIAVVGILCVALSVSYLAGSPRRASRTAFGILRALDQTTTAQDPAPYDRLLGGFQDAQSAAAMGALVKITPYLFGDDGSGAWVRTGRIVKYFSTLRPQDAQALDVLSTLERQPPSDNQAERWRGGCRALATVAKQYRRSRALREACYQDLAELLRVQADPQSVFKGLDDLNTQVLAWEGEQARRRQMRASSPVRTTPQRGPQYATARQSGPSYRGNSAGSARTADADTDYWTGQAAGARAEIARCDQEIRRIQDAMRRTTTNSQSDPSMKQSTLYNLQNELQTWQGKRDLATRSLNDALSHL